MLQTIVPTKLLHKNENTWFQLQESLLKLDLMYVCNDVTLGLQEWGVSPLFCWEGVKNSKSAEKWNLTDVFDKFLLGSELELEVFKCECEAGCALG